MGYRDVVISKFGQIQIILLVIYICIYIIIFHYLHIISHRVPIMVGYGLIFFDACFFWATSQFFDKPQSYCCASIYHHIPDKFGAP